MTTATGGLRLASDTSPTALAAALAAASDNDIAAGLSDERKASLVATLVPAPAAAEPKKGKVKKPSDDGDNEAGDGNDGDEDDKMKAARAEGFAAGQKASAERIAAVAASEHFAGHEKAAMKLLGSDKPLALAASAEDVLGHLADLPKGSEADTGMLDALRAEENPDLGNGGGDGAGAHKGSADHGWGKAQARVATLFGHGAPKK